MMEWIDIISALPETHEANEIYESYRQGDYVLAFCTDGTFAIVRLEIEGDGRLFFTDDSGASRKVTHWMPLPNAPKKKRRIK